MKATHANQFPEKRKASESPIGHDEKRPKSEDNAGHVFAAITKLNKRSTLLSLPAEIRNRIYRYAIGDHKFQMVKTMYKDYYELRCISGRRCRNQPGIWNDIHKSPRTGRQLHEETRLFLTISIPSFNTFALCLDISPPVLAEENESYFRGLENMIHAGRLGEILHFITSGNLRRLTKQTAGFLIDSKGLKTITFEVKNASSKERSRLLAIGEERSGK